MKLEERVANRLREARKDKGLTQEALGLAIGIEEATARTRVSQYESGRHTPPLSTIERLGQALDRSALWFICEDDEKGLLIALHNISQAKRPKVIQSLECVVLESGAQSRQD